MNKKISLAIVLVLILSTSFALVNAVNDKGGATISCGPDSSMYCMESHIKEPIDVLNANDLSLRLDINNLKTFLTSKYVLKTDYNLLKSDYNKLLTKTAVLENRMVLLEKRILSLENKYKK